MQGFDEWYGVTNLHRNKMTIPLGLLYAGLAVFWLSGCESESENKSGNRFVDEQACMECHQKEYREWQFTHCAPPESGL